MLELNRIYCADSLELMKSIPDKDIYRFFSKVEKTDSCWIWKADKSSFGYGRFWTEGKTVYSHRFSWLIHNGQIVGGLYVCHSCDVPSCVNPAHLFLGNAKDNMQDMATKNRGATGQKNGRYTHPESRRVCEQNGNSKITKDDVIKIRELRALKYSCSSIKRELNLPITAEMIRYIGLERYWKI